ncbi:MAG: radical SAM protein [Nitrospirae bacterium]|nr:radical SAM protein [Nitrospirota bacterium]
MKVTLVVPNFRWAQWDKNTLWHFVPYNLCLLAAMIEDICDVKIVDANVQNMSENDLRTILTEQNPDVVGITVLMDQYGPSGHTAARVVKDINNNIKTVIGGVYATMNSQTVIADENIDYVVMGEGEYVFRDLLGYFMGKNKIPDTGVAYRFNGDVINGGHSDFIQNLDALPLPAYHLIDFTMYSSKDFVTRESIDSPRDFPFARVYTSRGCPYGCCFCQVESISGKKFRPRIAQKVLEEIRWLKEKYGIKSIIFDDDNLYTDKKRAKAIFRGMIEQGLSMPWLSMGVAVFRLDEEEIDLMHKSGCKYIDIAIESGSQRVLKEVIRKPVDYNQAKKMVKKAKEYGIYVAANFIVGFPTETWDEIRATIRFAEELNVDYAKIFVAIPLRNTRLWDLSVETGALKTNFNQPDIRWSNGQLETDEFTANDLTILRAYEWDRINFTDPAKRKRAAEMMKITEEKLLMIRRDTLNAAISSLVKNT